MKPSPQLNPASFISAEYECTTYVATVEQGTTLDMLLDPKFWSHVANKLRPYDEIKVRCDDGTFYGHLLVLACDRTWARVFKLTFESLTSSDISLTQAAILEDYDVKFRGPRKWSVLRKSDNAVLAEGLHAEADARTWLTTHLQNQSPVT